MTKWAYTKGLQEIGKGIFAYLQPDGSWGWNNAGIVTDGNESLLVDTLYTLDLTNEMWAAMKAQSPAAESIDRVVNTHVNGDHCYGNQLFQGAEIIASKACAEEFATETPPQMMIDLLKAAPDMGDLGAFFAQSFGVFNFEGITLTPPTRTFEKNLQLQVGAKVVDLIEVGPCHTGGDVIVSIPEAGIVFAGDIIFAGGTPILWDGPVGNWVRACEMILDMKADIIVPGHGPISDKAVVEETRDYWLFLEKAARKRFEDGLSSADAAIDLAANPGKYGGWGDPERVVINVDALYREFKEDNTPANRVELFGLMAKIIFGK
jgi:cyclase